MEKWFENPEERLKQFAKILFVLSVIAFVILAIVFGFQKTYHSYNLASGGGYYKTEFAPAYFFGFLIGGTIASYVECLTLYALGELVANSIRISKNTKLLIERFENNNQK